MFSDGVRANIIVCMDTPGLIWPLTRTNRCIYQQDGEALMFDVHGLMYLSWNCTKLISTYRNGLWVTLPPFLPLSS